MQGATPFSVTFLAIMARVSSACSLNIYHKTESIPASAVALLLKNVIIKSRYNQHTSIFRNPFLFVFIWTSGMDVFQRQRARPAHALTSAYVIPQLCLQSVWQTHLELSLCTRERTFHDVYSEPMDGRWDTQVRFISQTTSGTWALREQLTAGTKAGLKN